MYARFDYYFITKLIQHEKDLFFTIYNCDSTHQ